MADPRSRDSSGAVRVLPLVLVAAGVAAGLTAWVMLKPTVFPLVVAVWVWGGLVAVTCAAVLLLAWLASRTRRPPRFWPVCQAVVLYVGLQWGGLLVAEAREEARIADCAPVIEALERYHATHGRYPAQETLAPPLPPATWLHVAGEEAGEAAGSWFRIRVANRHTFFDEWHYDSRSGAWEYVAD